MLPFTDTAGVATSTLAAAAIFNPLRRRVQHVRVRGDTKTKKSQRSLALPKMAVEALRELHHTFVSLLQF